MVFLGGLTNDQTATFELAAWRWTQAIVGDLLDVTVDGQTINNLRITAQGSDIDGPGEVRPGGTEFPASRQCRAAAFLPALGEMQFDSADLASMEADSTLNDVITHEMGHVIEG